MATEIPSQHASNKFKRTTPSTPRRYASHLDIFFYYPVGYCMTMILKSVSIGWDTQNLPQYTEFMISIKDYTAYSSTFLPVLLHFSPCGTLLQRCAQVTQATFTDLVFLQCGWRTWSNGFQIASHFEERQGSPPKKNGTCIEASGCFIEIHPWSLTTSLPLKNDAWKITFLSRWLLFRLSFALYKAFVVSNGPPKHTTSPFSSKSRINSSNSSSWDAAERHTTRGGWWINVFFDFCRDIMGWSCWRRGFHPPCFCCLLPATVFGENLGRDGFSSFWAAGNSKRMQYLSTPRRFNIEWMAFPKLEPHPFSSVFHIWFFTLVDYS